MVLVSAPRYLVTWLLVVAVLLIILLSSSRTGGYSMPDDDSTASWHRWHRQDPIPQAPELPKLPQEYITQESSSSPWCEARFGTPFLENARESQTSYCTSASGSNLTCFWQHVDEGEVPRADAMCYGRGAVYDVESRRFLLDCELRLLSTNETEAGVHEVPGELTQYWYETGPGVVMQDHLGFNGTFNNRKLNRTTILIKREGSGNPWHSLMEIMTHSYALDVLQISIDKDTNQPFLTAKDGESAQIVILDGHADGPYYDLWRLFAKMPIRRLNDLTADEPPSNIVLPFAGGSNTLWQGDWKALECRDSSLIKTFARRVLDHYKVSRPKHEEDVVVTFIKRTNTRKLINETSLLAAARAAIPHMQLNEVDFEPMSFADQLATVQKTDLLAGVHGAGLTHALFLPPGAAVAEIIPPKFFHKGFRNVAQLLGSGYFSTHGKAPPPEREGDENSWQMEAVEIEEERFVEFMREAVRSLYNRNGRSFDVL